MPRPLVFTNGVFDILHRGHVSYLDQAAVLGASLVVGVNTDESVRRLHKGPERPLNDTADRLAVLAALGSVSLVIPFAEDTPEELIRAVRPDVLVKGGDWLLRARGARMLLLCIHAARRLVLSEDLSSRRARSAIFWSTVRAPSFLRLRHRR